jgi:DNA gyrase subunit B
LGSIYEITNSLQTVKFGNILAARLLQGLPMTKYSAKDIKVLPATEAIRRYPLMYVDDITSHGLHQLVLKLISSTMNPQFANECTSLWVTIHSDESLSLKDDGGGLPIKPYSLINTQPLIEIIMTQLFAGRADEDIYKMFSYLLNLGSVINALSEWLELETVTEGIKYTMACSRGRITQSLRLIGESSDKGTYLRFKPDPVIWIETDFDINILATETK